MAFETALNLLWLAFCVFAVAGTLRARSSQVRAAVRAPVWLHVCGVILILAALFPYISATDDVLRIQHADLQQSQRDHRDTGKKAPSDTLIRLYETMDTPVVATVGQLSFVLIFVSLVVVALRVVVSRPAPLESGRAPPVFAS